MSYMNKLVKLGIISLSALTLMACSTDTDEGQPKEVETETTVDAGEQEDSRDLGTIDGESGSEYDMTGAMVSQDGALTKTFREEDSDDKVEVKEYADKTVIETTTWEDIDDKTKEETIVTETTFLTDDYTETETLVYRITELDGGQESRELVESGSGASGGVSIDLTSQVEEMIAEIEYELENNPDLTEEEKEHMRAFIEQ